MRSSTEIRVIGVQAGQAIRLLGAALHPVMIVVDTDPPSAAPGEEWQLQILGRREQAIVEILRDSGVTILASHEREHDAGASAAIASER